MLYNNSKTNNLVKVTFTNTIFFIVILFSFCKKCSGLLREYEVTFIKNNNDSHPAWADFDEDPLSKGQISTVTGTDDGPDFDQLDFCIPFFQQDSITPFISPNGYLAFGSQNPCHGFCMSNEEGRVIFDNSGYPGDFPIIGLYVFDLNTELPSLYTNGNKIYKLKKNKTYDGKNFEVMIVEFYKVRQYFNGEYSLPYSVTAEVELLPNGTIFLRFQEVFKDFISINSYAPATGLIWVGNQREVSKFVQYNEKGADYIAIRYDPKPNNCSIFNSSCDNCIKEEGCGWCSPNKECVPLKYISDVCSVGVQDTCYVPSLKDDSFVQHFYDVSIEYNSDWTNISQINDTILIPSAKDYFLNISFGFPIFYNPPNFTPNNTRVVKQLTISYDSTIRTIYPNSCNESTSKCGESDYLYTISPFGGSLSISAESLTQILNLNKRKPGTVFCPTSNTNDCPPGFVVQFSNFKIGFTNMTTTFQIFLDETGKIEIYWLYADQNSAFLNSARCETTSLFQQYPYTTMGIIKNGIDDNSSVLIPWTQIRDRTRLKAVLNPGCEDCGNGGFCNMTSRKCVCFPNFMGEDCEKCVSGYYGDKCKPCDDCLNGGKCIDGKTGNGYCNCLPPYSGKKCEKTCEGSWKNCTDGCFMGYCDCGICECDVNYGWSGDNCSTWNDPCWQYSLDGCPICISTAVVKCKYCMSRDYANVCFVTPNQDRPIGRKTKFCRSYIDENSPLCSFFFQESQLSSKWAVIAILVVFGTVALCSIITCAMICICRQPPHNPLLVNALPGVPDFTFPHREREVVGMTRVPIQGRRGRPVQGIPLKQIPLHELLLSQRKRRENDYLLER